MRLKRGLVVERSGGTYDRPVHAKTVVTAIEISNKTWLNFGVYLFGVRYAADDRLAKSVFAHIINVGSPCRDSQASSRTPENSITPYE